MSFSVFFVFKQKTAYEMRISDWSSDVCSSDLRIAAIMPSSLMSAATFSTLSAITTSRSSPTCPSPKPMLCSRRSPPNITKAAASASLPCSSSTMVRSLPPGGADRMAKSCRTISTPSTSCSERDNLPQRPAAYPAGLLLSNKSGAPHENDLRSRRRLRPLSRRPHASRRRRAADVRLRRAAPLCGPVPALIGRPRQHLKSNHKPRDHMKNIVIIRGPPGSGKSSLVRHLGLHGHHLPSQQFLPVVAGGTTR